MLPPRFPARGGNSSGGTHQTPNGNFLRETTESPQAERRPLWVKQKTMTCLDPRQNFQLGISDDTALRLPHAGGRFDVCVGEWYQKEVESVRKELFHVEWEEREGISCLANLSKTSLWAQR